jgi:acetyltransferase-like isoleucine patch superfamily enzyme
MTDFYTKEQLEKFGSCGDNVRIDSSVMFINPHNVHIGNNVRIDAFCFFSALNPIRIGSNVHISLFGQIGAAGGPVQIDDFAGLSSRVSIFTTTDDYSEGYMTNPTVPDRFKKVKGGGVWVQKHAIVGCGTVIMPNVTLETGCSVGALSFVNKTVPEFTIVAGNPMRLIGKRNKDRLLALEKEFYEATK